MAILEIIKFPNQYLQEKSISIEYISKEINIIIRNMIETMYHNNGLGLAAIQIGEKKNIIVINISQNIRQPLVIINPKIIYSKGLTRNKEGCLSFPNKFLEIKRKKIIKLKFLSIDNKKKIIKIDNILSICVQHEIDHLNGITLYNKISKVKKEMIFKKK